MSLDPTLPRRMTGGRLVALTIAVLFAAAMLRVPIVSVAPVAADIEASLGVSPAVIGLFTSIPVLAFAVCSPLAVAIIRRGGADFALTICLAGGILGTLIRSAGGLPAALIGTAVIGMFLTIGNVVVPLIIAREFPPQRVHFMTGVYTSSINVGTMTVTLATAPLAEGIGWQAALITWAGFGVVALVVWIGLHGLRGAFVPSPSPAAPTRSGSPGVARVASTWLLAATFAGQSFGFYGMTAWLPSILSAQGLGQNEAGAIASVFQVAAVIGALGLPLITSRASIATGMFLAAGAWVVFPLGFLLAPHLWLLWCLVGGLAQGAGITLVFIMITALGGGDRAVAGRSGLVQGVAFAIAATGPVVLGALHDATGAWTLPLVVVLFWTLVFGVSGSIVAVRIRR